MALGAVSAMLLAFPVTAPARVTADQTMHAAGAVRSSLTAISRSGHLTAGEKYSYRRSLRQAMRVLRKLDVPSKARRRDELASQIVTLATIAARGKLTPGRMQPLFRQLDANRIWFARSGPPRPLARVTVAGDPLVYAYYPGHGLQLQPLFNWTKVNGYWFAKDYDGMQKLIDRLAPLAVRQPGGWVSWEYAFDYPGSRAPWLSGMAQGVAIQALARAWQVTQNPEDLALAQQALPGLGRSLAAGGLLKHSASGRWWPLYAEHPSLRVLNGDLQTVISLYDYAAITGDTKALAWAQDGSRAAAALLPRYDTGAWSLYQGSREAPLGYHDLMTLQLRQLALKSGDPVFRTYADRFALYRVTPPVIAVRARPPVRVYPTLADSPHADFHVPARINKASSVALVVTDAEGSVVTATRLGKTDRGWLTARWNGFDGLRPVAPGAYQVWLRATDVVGNLSPRTLVGDVLVERDTEAPEVRMLRLIRAGGDVRLRWRVSDNAAGHLTIAISTPGHTLVLHDMPLNGRRALSLPSAPPGLTAAITITDESGNHAWETRRAL